MLRSTLGKVMWIGRTAAAVFGLALVLALILGVTSAAFGADTDPFRLGRQNLAESVSRLVKSGAGPALDLQVDSGPPLKVNSSAKVANLNVDRLDGKSSTAFVPTDTYVSTRTLEAPTTPGIDSVSVSANCNQGLRDMVISGGVRLDAFSTDIIIESKPSADPAFVHGWTAGWRSDSTANVKGGTVYALCASMP